MTSFGFKDISPGTESELGKNMETIHYPNNGGSNGKANGKRFGICRSIGTVVYMIVSPNTGDLKIDSNPI